MLTFFEYLRQRAFESVLSGAQEALEFLERQEALAEPKKQLAKGNENNDEKLKPPRKREEQLVPPETKPASRSNENDPLSKPNKPGRSAKDEKGRK